MNKDFSLRNPAIITTQKFCDGEFFALGNIILGMDHSRNHFISFNTQPIHNGCFCCLFIWKFDRSHISVSNPIKQIILFTNNGLISASPNNFEITLIEFLDQPIEYLVFGRSISSDSSFLYITFIMKDEKNHNFHFSINDSNFEYNASTSILFNPLSIAVNCVSTVKIIIINQDASSTQNKIKTIQFDVENYLKSRLQSNIKNVDFYETSIIGKNESDSSFIIFVGFSFYNQINNKWTAAFILMNVPVNGRTMRQLHQESVSFEKRPQGDELKEIILKWKDEFILAAKEKIDSRLNVLSNKNRPGIDLKGVRLIKIPEMNIIIADERNGIIKF